jgi:homoserine dehydrogenase
MIATITATATIAGAASATATAAPSAEDSLLVLELDASLLAGEEDLPLAVHEIYRRYRAGRRIVAVVPALGRGTERLREQARRVSGGAELAPHAVAALLATGEAAAAALLVLALDRAGVPAAIFDPRRARSRTCDPPLDAGLGGGIDAGLRGLDAGRLCACLARQARRAVVVVPGCLGEEAAAAAGGGLGLSGRGASPLAALRLARRLGAEHRRLARNVDGSDEHGPAPLRVVLLGLGTVGGGVYRHLLAQLDRFAVVGAAVRDPEPHIRAGVPATLLERDPWRLLERPCDLVVEALGGTDPAARLIAAALAAGRDVVSANKEVIAGEGEWLLRHAAAHGAELRFSAAVGGSVPMLEAVTRAAAAGEIRALRGVLNGTSNFVLDRLAAGSELAAAVRLAQEKGFAEADPAHDLDGRDAACKLRILARAAFGVELAAGAVVRRGLESVDGAAAAAARARGQAIRLLAECRREGAALRAEVRPVALPARDFLAGARGEENRCVIERAGGPPLRLAGRGAGRWPTAEAAIADVLDVMRLRHRGPTVRLAAAPRGAAGVGA